MEVNIQKEYFNHMRQVKFAIIYLDLYADWANSIDTFIKIVIAFASSASIAAWAVWQMYPFFWSCIIALANIFAAVSKYLPYSMLIKSIADHQVDLKLLYIDLEYNWFYIVSESMKKKKINELLCDQKRQYVEIEKNIIKNRPIRPNPRLQKKAEEQTNEYFENLL